MPMTKPSAVRNAEAVQSADRSNPARVRDVGTAPSDARVGSVWSPVFVPVIAASFDCSAAVYALFVVPSVSESADWVPVWFARWTA